VDRSDHESIIAEPVSAPTRTVPAAPTFAVGTANAPALAKTTRPGNVLAARAMMSGPGVLVAESVIVFTPGMVNAGMTPSHAEPGNPPTPTDPPESRIRLASRVTTTA